MNVIQVLHLLVYAPTNNRELLVEGVEMENVQWKTSRTNDHDAADELMKDTDCNDPAPVPATGIDHLSASSPDGCP